MARRYGFLGVVAAGAILLAVLIVRLAMVEIVPAPLAAANPLAPDHPDLTFAAAPTTAEQGPSAALLREMRNAALHAPLAAEPFLAFASSAARRSDETSAVRLLEEARRRDPRNRAVRLLLMQRYVAQGNVPSAIDELVVMTRLLPDGNDMIVAYLAQLAADPATAEATKRALAAKPSLDGVLDYLAMNRADPDLILSLAEERGPSAGPAPQWQGTLLRNLVESGAIRRAHRLWREFYRTRAVSAANLVYDPAFRGLPGAPPFNWRLADGEIGAAEASSDGGLQIDYFGRESGTLAEQLLVLAPGTYSLAMQAEGSEHEDSSQLEWTISCNSGDRALAALSLEGIDYAPRRFSTRFIVPRSGCNGQWLRLIGRADEFPVAKDAKISNLSLRREAGRS